MINVMARNHLPKSEIVVAILLPILVYVLDWATIGRQAPLYIAPSWGAPRLVFVIVALLPLVWLILGSGALGYVFMRRKLAVVAAIATGLFAYGLLAIAPIAARQIGVVASLLLAGVATSLAFYLLYGFLTRTSRPKIMSAVAIMGALVFITAASIVSLYFLRLNFYL